MMFFGINRMDVEVVPPDLEEAAPKDEPDAAVEPGE